MLNYITDIKPLEDKGLTDQQIVDTIKGYGLTVRDISVPTLKAYLSVEWRLLYTDITTGLPAGPIVDLAKDPRTPAELVAGITTLIEHVNSPHAHSVRLSSRPDFAAVWHAVVALLSLPNDILQTLETLHGGRKHANITTEDVVNSRAEYIKQEEIERVRLLWQNAMSAAVLAASRGEDSNAAGLAVINGES